MVSGSRFRGLLFRVGLSTFAKQNVLEGASVGKLGNGERESRGGRVFWGLGAGGISGIKVGPSV